MAPRAHGAYSIVIVFYPPASVDPNVIHAACLGLVEGAVGAKNRRTAGVVPYDALTEMARGRALVADEVEA